MKIKNRRDFYAGLMFMLFGIGFMVMSQAYTMGSASKMGPAYFPTVLGGILTVLGFIVLIGSVAKDAPELTVERFQFDVIGYILGAVAVFAAILVKGGFLIALIALIIISARSSHEFSWRDTIISVVVLAIGSWGIFIKGLELQMPVLPKFLGL